MIQGSKGHKGDDHIRFCEFWTGTIDREIKHDNKAARGSGRLCILREKRSKIHE